MSHDIPDNLQEKEVPETLRTSMFKFGKFEDVTPEEVQKYDELLNGSESIEELEAKWLILSSQCEEVAREWIESTGERSEELNRLNTELWRKLIVYRAAIKAKSGKN